MFPDIGGTLPARGLLVELETVSSAVYLWHFSFEGNCIEAFGTYLVLRTGSDLADREKASVAANFSALQPWG